MAISTNPTDSFYEGLNKKYYSSVAHEVRHTRDGWRTNFVMQYAQGKNTFKTAPATYTPFHFFYVDTNSEKEERIKEVANSAIYEK